MATAWDRDEKRRVIYGEMIECVAEIKKKVDNEETMERYTSLLIRFMRGRSSLLDVDDFSREELPSAALTAHEKLFSHLWDGAEVPQNRKAMAEARKRKAIPSEAFVTFYLYLMGARNGIKQIDPKCGQLIIDAIRFHVKGIIEDAVRVRLQSMVSPAGSLRLNPVIGKELRKRNIIRMKDVRDGIEMANGSARWVKFASDEEKEKLRRKFAEKKD